LWSYKPLSPAEKLPQAKAAALRAIALDPGLIEARLQLVDYALSWDRDWPAAENHLQRALASAPGNAKVHQSHAAQLYLKGDFERGLKAMQRGLAIDPLSLVLNADLAWYYTVSGNYEQALKQCDLLLKIKPDNQNAQNCPMQPYLMMGNIEAAAQNARMFLSNAGMPDEKIPNQDAGILLIYWETLRDFMLKSSESRYIDPVSIAQIYAQLGNPERALHWLEKAIEQHSGFAPYIHLFPEFRSLHQNPIFPALLRKTGLSDTPELFLSRL